MKNEELGIKSEHSAADNLRLGDLRVAVCGKLDTACKTLREEGIYKIDKYQDALDLAFNLQKGMEYHLILVYAPQGEGLDTDYPFKSKPENEWKIVPVKLLNEPACHSALVELKSVIRIIAKEQLNYVQDESG